jgi:negative regulator of flagellin synthesis FlgM
MKIGNTAVSPNVATVGQTSSRGAADGTRTQGSSATGNGAASATVSLSGAARALLDAGDGTFDANKVEQVRQSIADGTYKINADAIADKLISNARELLGSVGKS